MATIEKRVTSTGEITWRARIRQAGVPHLTKTFTKKTDAQAWAREIESRLDRGFAMPSRDSTRRTVADGIDRWLEERLPEISETDQKNMRQMLAWWNGELGRVALMRLDPEAIKRSAKKLRDEKDKKGERVRSDARVNRYLQALSRVLGYCVRALRWIESNPCAHVSRFKESRGRLRFLTEAETETLLRAVDVRGKADFSLFVRIALGTGARRGEVANLQWRDVDQIHKRVTFRHTKNGESRTVPLPEILIEAIKEFGKVRPINADAPLFPHEFRYDWREVQGVLPDFKFHDTRHTVASHLAMSGASLLDIAAVTGHKTLAMVKRYSHLSDDHVRSKLEEATAKLLKR